MRTRRKLIGFLMALAYFCVAGPGSVVLHAIDHVVDFHLSHSHDYGSESDNNHHDKDHNHQQIFSFQTLPSSVPQSWLPVAAPEIRLIQDTLLFEPMDGLLVDVLQQNFRTTDPPIFSTSPSLTSSFLNRAPPLA